MRGLWMLGLVACGGGSAPTTTTSSGATAHTAAPAATGDTAAPTSAGSPTVVLVLTPSDAMADVATSLAVGIDTVLAAAGGPVAVTTTDLARAGALAGPATTDREALAAQVLCHATCFRADLEVASDPGHACGDPLGSEVTVEWLDCACGVGAWREGCGQDVDGGLEATLLATCRADAAAPATCLDEGTLEAADLGAVDLGDAVHAVIVTDEGDQSPRLDREPEARVYVEALAASSLAVTVSAVLPPMAGGRPTCPGLATDWGVARYLDAVAATGGRSADVFDAGCARVDGAAAVVEVLTGP